jgi:hypothetical protein
MRKVLGSFAVILALSLAAFGQQYGNVLSQNSPPYHRFGSIFFAPAYSTWQATIISGNTTTGAGTSIIVAAAGQTVGLKDGTNLPLSTVFNTSTPIYVQDANAEVVTPTGVTVSTCPAGNLGVGGSGNACATITGNFANTHGQSALVVSGDGGIEEAITDAGLNGGGQVNFEADCGRVTMNTGGVTTTTTNCQIPLNAVGTGASTYVTTTITTTATYSLGIAGSTTLFYTSCASLTAGLNCSAKNVAPTESATGTSYALTPLIITANAASGAGVVHIKAWGYSQVQSVQ